MLKELLGPISTLQKEMTELKKDRVTTTNRTYPQRRPRNSSRDAAEGTHDGEEISSEHEGNRNSDANEEENEGDEVTNLSDTYQLPV